VIMVVVEGSSLVTILTFWTASMVALWSGGRPLQHPSTLRILPVQMSQRLCHDCVSQSVFIWRSVAGVVGGS
jgi:hypothetical protein